MKFYKIRYKNKRILLGYCDRNFEWYCTKIKGVIILCINNNLSLQDKSKILHNAIRAIS